ncbi:MAG TPA: phosphoribosylanthranilate isomerase [Alphaproteobacteria bacterium]|nr:phosphoribosylanthranilate isomerase [Alphaproteobacteria bacterium]
MPIDVKICGIRTPEALHAATGAGARAVGFVFYPPSPRALTPDIAADLSRMLPTGVRAVGLFVDAGDGEIGAVTQRVPLDLLQLHGDETPRRVAEIRGRFGLPVMKAIRVATAVDLAPLPDYEAVADWILFDAKPPKNVTSLPGGTGIAFDWQLLKQVNVKKPWMLSGGLNAGNLGEAVSLTGAKMVDVSSGVEDRPGVKSVERIREFLGAAARL